MRNFLKKIWEKVVAWIDSIPADLKLHFSAGVICAAFFAIALGMKVCFWPVIFVAFFKEFIDLWVNDSGFDAADFAATLVGALVPQAFALLNLWWF